MNRLLKIDTLFSLNFILSNIFTPRERIKTNIIIILVFNWLLLCLLTHTRFYLNGFDQKNLLLLLTFSSVSNYFFWGSLFIVVGLLLVKDIVRLIGIILLLHRSSCGSNDPCQLSCFLIS